MIGLKAFVLCCGPMGEKKHYDDATKVAAPGESLQRKVV